jgi:hypothetical protein
MLDVMASVPDVTLCLGPVAQDPIGPCIGCGAEAWGWLWCEACSA